MIEDTDKAYIAGLFDGEGSIHIRRGIEKKKKHILILTTNTAVLWTFWLVI